MHDFTRLNVKTNDNEISNVNDIRNFLDEISIDDDIKRYLETLLNRIKYSEFSNKDELVEVISAKLLELDIQEDKAHTTNKESLEKLQAYNDDFNKISIISTSMNNNDSGKDIDYITFINRRGEAEMLTTHDARALNDYIKAHARELTSLTAEDVFHRFKEYVYQEVEFMTPETMDERHPEHRDRAVRNETYIKEIEMNAVEKYKNTFGITAPIEVAVDQDGERLYRIGDGIIKFEGEQRDMRVLRKPEDALTLGETINPDAIEEHVEKVEVEEIVEEITPEEEIETTIKESEFTSYSLEELWAIITEVNEGRRTLSPEEEKEIQANISYYIHQLEQTLSNNETEEFERIHDTVKLYMDAIMDLYNDIKTGALPESALPIEKYLLAQEYDVVAERLKEIEKNRKMSQEAEKRLILQNNNPNGTMGISTLVIILELALVGMYILMFLSLAK